jgi:hypothetical protein
MSCYVLARHCARVAPGSVARSAMYNIGTEEGPWTRGTVMAFPSGELNYFDTHGKSIDEVAEWRDAVLAWQADNPKDRP